jgi:hypothetical protein
LNTKKILLISYSQSGQLSELTSSVISPLLSDRNIEIIHKNIKPIAPYPYPWGFVEFMDAFPESVLLKPCKIQEIPKDDNNYDLVIIAYQVWFLAPSIPITAFMKSSYAKEKLKNTPVITLIGCRNMWTMAQSKMQLMIDELDAKLIDNIVLIDQGSSLATFITTPRWMLTGKKNAFWGFPEAGILPQDIKDSSRFGEAILQGLKNDKEKKYQPLCSGLGAVNVDIKLIKSEQIATKSFTIWGKLISAVGKPGSFWRKPLVMLYLVFLVLIILTIVPISMIIQIISRKLNKEKMLKIKEELELPSRSDTSRIKEFLNE